MIVRRERNNSEYWLNTAGSATVPTGDDVAPEWCFSPAGEASSAGLSLPVEHARGGAGACPPVANGAQKESHPSSCASAAGDGIDKRHRPGGSPPPVGIPDLDDVCELLGRELTELRRGTLDELRLYGLALLGRGFLEQPLREALAAANEAATSPADRLPDDAVAALAKQLARTPVTEAHRLAHLSSRYGKLLRALWYALSDRAVVPVQPHTLDTFDGELPSTSLGQIFGWAREYPECEWQIELGCPDMEELELELGEGLARDPIARLTAHLRGEERLSLCSGINYVRAYCEDRRREYVDADEMLRGAREANARQSESWRIPEELVEAVTRIVAATPVEDLSPPIAYYEGAADHRMAAARDRWQDERLAVAITTDEHLVTERALIGLAASRDLYVRGGKLVHVVMEGAVAPGGPAQGTRVPRIALVRQPLLRMLLSRHCRFSRAEVSFRGSQGNPSEGDSSAKAIREIPSGPPKFVVEAIDALGEYPGLRTLRGISTVPFLRPDGSVVAAAGWDESTGVLFRPVGPQPVLPERPTQDDALAAAAELLDLVADFPFAAPEHRAGWLALLLTAAGRHAFDGPSPLFLIDANTRGSGKGLLAALAGTIVAGTPIPVTAAPQDDSEFRKRITAIAIEGGRFVLFDNVAGVLGVPSLDAALTSTVWKDRLLGRSEMTEVPLMPVWVATGNNVSLGADTARRVLHVRLESPLERPEERSGFHHLDILTYTVRERARYLRAVLVILQAWFAAGRPTRRLPSWGSFEGWSAVIRQAIVWVDQPDPFAARECLLETADTEAAHLAATIMGLEEMVGDGTESRLGITASEILRRLKASEHAYPRMRAAVEEVSGKSATPKSLGKRLAGYRGRVIDGKAIVAESHRKVLHFSVRSAPALTGASMLIGDAPIPRAERE